MLALAHGSKGIMPWMFSSNISNGEEINCGGNYVYYESIVNEEGTPTDPSPGSTVTLYDYLKDELVPRLKGKLGRTLLAVSSVSYTALLISAQQR